jgi:hypothetical protein
MALFKDKKDGKIKNARLPKKVNEETYIQMSKASQKDLDNHKVSKEKFETIKDLFPN